VQDHIIDILVTYLLRVGRWAISSAHSFNTMGMGCSPDGNGMARWLGWV